MVGLAILFSGVRGGCRLVRFGFDAACRLVNLIIGQLDSFAVLKCFFPLSICIFCFTFYVVVRGGFY